jgi:hypothetical protein
MASGNNLTLLNNYCPHRHFFFLESLPGLFQGFLHIILLNF